MDIALEKRRENIAEYILYLWQVEDLLRALQLSPEAVYGQLVAPRGLKPEQAEAFLNWYMEIAGLLQKEGKEEKGHLEHTLHLVADLQDLHLRLLKLPAGEAYRATYAAVEPLLPSLRGQTEYDDVELAFRALYAAMRYKMQGKTEKAGETIAVLSPWIARLAALYKQVEEGKIDLYKE